MVATKERKGLRSMDIVAVLTKVVQEQRGTINEPSKEIKELKRALRSGDTVTSVDSLREVSVE